MPRRMRDAQGDWWQIEESAREGAAVSAEGRRTPSAGPHIVFVREADQFRIWTPSSRPVAEMDDEELRDIFDECRRRYPSEAD